MPWTMRSPLAGLHHGRGHHGRDERARAVLHAHHAHARDVHVALERAAVAIEERRRGGRQQPQHQEARGQRHLGQRQQDGAGGEDGRERQPRPRGQLQGKPRAQLGGVIATERRAHVERANGGGLPGDPHGQRARRGRGHAEEQEQVRLGVPPVRARGAGEHRRVDGHQHPGHAPRRRHQRARRGHAPEQRLRTTLLANGVPHQPVEQRQRQRPRRRRRRDGAQEEATLRGRKPSVTSHEQQASAPLATTPTSMARAMATRCGRR
jgi:hypothetical protein